MTPEPLGPFVPRPAPIRACHPKPIDEWLTSLQSQPCCPCPCMCMWRIVHHCPIESPASTTEQDLDELGHHQRSHTPHGGRAAHADDDGRAASSVTVTVTSTRGLISHRDRLHGHTRP